MAKEQFCVVCGMGSHKDTWVKSATVAGVKHVACDTHSQSAVDAAAKAKTPPAPTPRPVPARAPGRPLTASKPTIVPRAAKSDDE